MFWKSANTDSQNTYHTKLLQDKYLTQEALDCEFKAKMAILDN